MCPLIYALISALGNTANSLGCTGAIKTKQINSAFVTLASLLPSFLISLVWSHRYFLSLTFQIAGAMICKNALYGIALYLRFRGLAHLGAFQGAVLSSSQPVIISFLSLIFLNEYLSWNQWFGVIIITMTLIIPIYRSENSMSDILKFAVVPSFLQSLIIVIDRFVLTNSFTPREFFLLDKLILFPVTTLTLSISRIIKISNFSFNNQIKIKNLFWLVLLGSTWGLSSYTYGVSLAGQKTTLVSVVRNLAFPLAAIGSVIIFNEKLTTARINNLILSIIACIMIFL